MSGVRQKFFMLVLDGWSSRRFTARRVLAWSNGRYLKCPSQPATWNIGILCSKPAGLKWFHLILGRDWRHKPQTANGAMQLASRRLEEPINQPCASIAVICIHNPIEQLIPNFILIQAQLGIKSYHFVPLPVISPQMYLE
ncbi:hypothetical protein PGT21_007845 [Puccinia graminis f. sp. tritici]|uniref:Uncharacterized protein n=1 Tax=Puccinia graminis f. sp. tritici TaxID=56615 RepID=A0A5B0P419_PUCGR|nr:hypothetical protein PGT21_007845 [Puccinia graminis f. sp. tritici]KAA1099067.1 hypothetical protein PGTUg99_012710 [Puccinia graminis f. sp. tritici]